MRLHKFDAGEMADKTSVQETTESEARNRDTRIEIWSADERVVEKLALKTADDRNEVSEACLQSLNKRVPSPSPSGERTTLLTWSGCKLYKTWKDTFHVVASSTHDVVLGSEASDKLLEAERRSQALLALAEKQKKGQLDRVTRLVL